MVEFFVFPGKYEKNYLGKGVDLCVYVCIHGYIYIQITICYRKLKAAKNKTKL